MGNILSQKIDQYFTKDKKGFGFGENAVQKFIVDSFKDDSETSDEIKQSESLAFAFSENESSNENYFGPTFIGTDEDGNRVEAPSLAQVTPEMIDYWEVRGGESPNPIVKARYLGLVWHLKKRIAETKPNFNIAQNYLDTLIEIANGDYYNPPLYVYPKLKHGLDMAVSFKDTVRIKAFVTAIIEFEKRHAEDDKAGTWGEAFDLLFDKRGVTLSADEESSIISDLESRMARLEKMSDTRGVELCGKRIAKYHLKHNRPQDVRDLILNPTSTPIGCDVAVR